MSAMRTVLLSLALLGKTQAATAAITWDGGSVDADPAIANLLVTQENWVTI
jgi:hypothetical protein